MISLFLCDSLNEPNVMTERARALIGRMVVFGDTIGERVGLMFLTYYGRAGAHAPECSRRDSTIRVR